MNIGAEFIGKIDYFDGLPSYTKTNDFTVMLMIIAHLLGNRKVTLFHENCQSVYAEELGQQLG